MVALRVIVHTPYERVALAIPSTLYPSEATFFIQFLLQRHHTLDPAATDPPQYVDIVSASPWQLAHLTNGALREDRNLLDNGIRDGDTLLFSRDVTPEPITTSAISSAPEALTAPQRLSEIQHASHRMSRGAVMLWAFGCALAAFFPSWWSFGGILGSLALLLGFIMVVMTRQGRDEATPLSWAALTMAAAGGCALPGGALSLSWPTRILIAVSCVLLTLLGCHILRILSLQQEPFAAVGGVLILLILGLTLVEYGHVPARSLAAAGMMLAATVLLAAPRLALWIARVKIPLTALIDVDLPLLPRATIDSELARKVERARWLQATLTLAGTFLSVVCTLPLVGWPWARSYDPPNPWQWILLALLVVSLMSAALHAVYRTHVRWILGAVLAMITLVAVLVSAITLPVVGLVVMSLYLVGVGSLWLWGAQWNLTPVAQKILDVGEAILLAIIFPLGIVATGLVSFLLTL